MSVHWKWGQEGENVCAQGKNQMGETVCVERRSRRKCAQGKNRMGEKAAHRKKAKQEKMCVHRGKTGENVCAQGKNRRKCVRTGEKQEKMCPTHTGDTDRKTTVIFTELPVMAVLLM